MNYQALIDDLSDLATRYAGDSAMAALCRESALAIQSLRATVAELRVGEHFHAVAVQQRDQAWTELTALRAEVELLREEVAMYRSALANALMIPQPRQVPPCLPQ